MTKPSEREKIDEELLEIEKKLLRAEEEMSLEDKALVLALRMLQTAIADMPLALAAAFAGAIEKLPMSAAEKVTRTVATTPKPPAPYTAFGAVSKPAPTATPAPFAPTAFGAPIPTGPATPNAGAQNVQAAAFGNLANVLKPPPPPPAPVFPIAKILGTHTPPPAQKAPIPIPGGPLVGAITRIGGTITGVLGKLVSSFANVISPMAVMSATINSANSGFNVMNSAVKLLGATLAPLILPVALALATGFIALADKIAPLVAAVFPALARFIFSTLIPAMILFGDVVVETAKRFMDLLPSDPFKVTDKEREKSALAGVNPQTNIGLPEELRIKVNKATQEVLKERPDLEPGFWDRGSTVIRKLHDAREIALNKSPALKAEVLEAVGYKPGDEPGKPTGAGKGSEFSGAFRDVIESFRRGMMPKSQQMGVAAAYTAARQAALNADPIENRMLAALLRTAKAVEDIAGEGKRRDHSAAYDTSEGGDTSTGGGWSWFRRGSS